MYSTKTPYEPYALPNCAIDPPEGYQFKGVWKVEQLDEADGTDENAVELAPGAEITPEKKYLRLTALWISEWGLLQQQINELEDGGTITLTKDLTATDKDIMISIPHDKTVTIDLNGHTLNRGLTSPLTRAGEAVYIENTAKVTIKNGTITGGSNGDFGGGVSVYWGAELHLSNVTVTGNHTDKSGGGVYVFGDASLILDNCAITGNTAGVSGSGIGTYPRSADQLGPIEASRIVLNGSLTTDDLFLADQAVIEVAVPLNGAVIPVSVDSFSEGVYSRTLTSGLSGKGTAGSFISVNPAYVIVTNSDGEAVLTSTDNLSFGAPDFTLPSAVSAVEAEAFDSAAMKIVFIPDGCASIGDHAFRNCAKLEQIRIPAGCSLGEGVFDGCGAVYVFAPKGSPAEAYCLNHSNCFFVEQAQ